MKNPQNNESQMKGKLGVKENPNEIFESTKTIHVEGFVEGLLALPIAAHRSSSIRKDKRQNPKRQVF
jgi:hypothetical protein